MIKLIERLFGPTIDALGHALLNFLLTIVNKTNISKEKYIELKKLIEKNHTENSHIYFNQYKTYIEDEKINNLIKNLPLLIKLRIKNEWIRKEKINKYRESDIYFAGTEIFINELKKKDIKIIFQRFKENDQACLWAFLGIVEKKRPKLLMSEHKNYLQCKRNEYEKRNEDF